MVIFQEERFADFMGEAKPLLERHWEEIARNKDRVPLRIDHVRYAALDERGQLLICTARSAGRLIGYTVYFVTPSVHYATTMFAESDVFWLHPEFRGGRTAMRLFSFTETALAKRGVVIMHTRAKNDHPAAGRMLQHLDHTPIETIYAKVLG